MILKTCFETIWVPGHPPETLRQPALLRKALLAGVAMRAGARDDRKNVKAKSKT